jgi:hypothetical protein
MREPADPLDTPGANALPLTDRDAIRAACQRLAEGAGRELVILSRDLDPGYYDQRGFLDAVRNLALMAPRLAVRVLVHQPRIAVARGHRLIELARHFTSAIAIRRLGDEFRDRGDAYLVADGRGYCRRPLADCHEALWEPDAPRQARLLRADFDHLWEYSDGDPELRRLYL